MNGTKSTDGKTFGAIHAALVGAVNHSTRTVLGRAVSFLAVASLAVASLIPLSALAAPAGRVPERILVQPKDAAPEAEVQALFASHGVAQVGAIHQINVRVLHVPEARLDTVLAALQHNPNIEFAEPDYLVEPDLVPNDTYYSSEWHLQKVQAPQAWNITTGSNTITIAVLDTGVEPTHPDLSAKLVPGWNFYDNNSNTADLLGHGTAVAGTAAAMSDNTTGVASLAWGCLIMPIRITDTNGNAALSTIASALSWAADNGARVANVSYSVSWSSTVASGAQYFMSKGGLTTISAGNDGKLYTWTDNPYVLTVSATDANDVITTWSTTGDNIDISAPGVNVMTTAVGARYGNASGTSFSSPIVAGVAALVLSINPSLSGAQLRTLLEQSADDLGPAGWDTSYGYGRVNGYKAVVAAGGSVATNTPAPIATILSPAAGSVISNLVTVSVSATDTVGIAMVKCYLNGTCVGTNLTVPAAFSWDTTRYANGSYALQALAVDAAGNTGTSSVVTVTVQNPVADTTPPTAQITSPANGATVSGVNSVNVSATDNVGVTRVELYLDGALAGSSATASPTFSWDTTTSGSGSHTLQAKAYDAAGNSSMSVSVTVTVQNAVADTTPPTVQVTSPTSGTTVASKATKVYVTASDNVGVARVDLLVDGKNYATSSSATPVFSCNTSKLSRGSHSLQAVAYDAAGNSTRSTVITVYK